MRIVQVCPYDLQRPGGVQRHVLDLSRALVRAGHEVTILAPGAPGSVAPAGAAHTDSPPSGDAAADAPRIVTLGAFRVVHVLGTGFELSLAQREQVDRALLQAQPELVHFHTIWTPVMSWQVWAALGGWPRTARVATFHDTPPDGWSGHLMRAVFGVASSRISRRLQVAIPVSQAPAAHLRLAPGCARHILPGCIDLSAYAGSMGPPREAATVLFLGRLEPRKGPMVMLRAWAQVALRHPGARLVVAGDGPMGGAARTLARELGIASSVHFAGAVDEAAKREWLARATILCAPSLYGESYGLVLAEAMAAGTPVIAAANAGYSQVLVGAGAQGLVAPGDAHALAQRLDLWLSDEQLRAQQSLWGRKACAQADINHQLPVFERIYADALSSKLDGSGK